MSKGPIIARTKTPPCRCGSESWEGTIIDDFVCRECGTTYRHGQEDLRELQGAEWTRGHRFYCYPLDDPSDETTIITIWTGRDDQRPDHDPEAGWFRPICVASYLTSGGLSDYEHYCGACRRRWGGGYGWVYCPYCAAGIATYVFADGLQEHHPKDWGDKLPEVWPDA